MIRVSRPCYDKLHRCPGWAGGGMRHAKAYRCESGSLAGYGGAYYRKDGQPRGMHWRRWRFNRCPKCAVVVLPSVVRWLDWRWWQWKIRRWAGDLKYELEIRRRG